MITAYGDDSTRRKALEGGAEALLTKPIDFVALRGEIDNRVAGARAEGRGRDEDFSSPPAQIPACAANAPGSSLGSDVVR